MNNPSKFTIGSKRRNSLKIGCGSGEPVRIIANIGSSKTDDSVFTEVEKAKKAFNAGADIITDHSISGDIERIHYALLDQLPCPLSTVSIYRPYIEYRKGVIPSFSPAILIKSFEQQSFIGFDLITVHATILKEDLPKIASSTRIIPSTSRGGMMMADIMLDTNVENPYWENFDDLLEIAKENGTCISLGTTFRPGSILDYPDELYNQELERMKVLVRMAINKHVGIMIEGIGHSRIDIIPDYVKNAKKICFDVPYRVLTVGCDSAIGRDHISSAIASAIAVSAGADVISAVSRSEHLKKPSIEDIVEAVESAKIAAHCGDIIRRNDSVLDKLISERRAASLCSAPGVESLFPKDRDTNDYECTMCASTCALRIMRKIKNYVEGI